MVCVLLLAALAGPAAGQLVVVQPGYVKAPFVRVFTNPDGSSYVRAPFVEVYSPPHFHHHAAPTPDELAEYDWWMLRRVAREAASRLDNSLSQFPTGDVWRRHFQTRELAQLDTPHSESVPTPEDQARFSAWLAIYNAGAESDDLRAVTQLTDYRVLHTALRELALPPATRQRGQLATSARLLDRALEDFRTGDTWRKYLALPEGVFAAERSAEGAADPQQVVDAAALLKLRERFDTVNENEAYRGIARLPEFQTTRQRLARYLELSSVAPEAVTPDAEVLPAPRQPSDK
jgi:hypothetical protein